RVAMLGIVHTSIEVSQRVCPVIGQRPAAISGECARDDLNETHCLIATRVDVSDPLADGWVTARLRLDLSQPCIDIVGCGRQSHHLESLDYRVSPALNTRSARISVGHLLAVLAGLLDQTPTDLIHDAPTEPLPEQVTRQLL